MPVHDLRRVLAAEAVSNFGSMLSRLAIPFLATLALQASAAQMAALLVADAAAGALGVLWLGSLIDRHGKRAVSCWPTAHGHCCWPRWQCWPGAVR